MTAHQADADGVPEVPPRAEPEVAAVAQPGGRLVVCAPLVPEARAVRPGIGGGGEVRVSGYGPGRARKQAERLRQDTFGALAVAGTGGGLTDDVRPGDLVVATGVTDGSTATACPSAALLAGELRRAGLTVRTGPVVSVERLAGGRERARAVDAGALAVDLESAWLAAAAGGRPVAVVRAISDTPQRPLRSPAALAGGLRALRSLRAAGPALTRWAAAAGPRRVLLAGPRSFCAGVERAIEIVEKLLQQQGPPVYVRKQIVHNTHVVADLERRGAVFVDELDEVPDGACVVFSAHGVSPAARAVHRGRHLPAGVEGARGGAPVRRGRVPGGADRPRRPRGGRGDAGRGAGGHGPGRDGRRRNPPAPAGPGQGRLPHADHPRRR
jgi:4-hydroxy-3-methylbut-2-enyl diphosphate reductase